jgi:hypothetical protein
LNYSYIFQNSDGSPSRNPILYSQKVTHAAANLPSCLLHFERRSTTDGVAKENTEAISFRRVEKLEVARVEDIQHRLSTSQLGKTVKVDPGVYRLTITWLGGGQSFLFFRDEEIANRIAKAMNHAVELCGGGSKDPF